MNPGKYNMVCPQGSTFTKQLTYTIDDVPVNLTGYTARMQVREKHTSASVITSITTENGGISINSVNGKINLYLSSTATAAIVAKEYVYDLELVSSNNVYRLIEGKFIVTPEVTR